jgi:prepilin-type N-terminal cleavage/methylation domain-containing protein
MRARRTGQSGLTLMEVLIAVTLFGVLSVAMLFAMRIGLNTFGKTNAKLMDNRRVAGAQRILEQQIEGMMPVIAPCLGTEAATRKIAFFQGQPQTMRLVSTFSLQEGWRGEPLILEFAVIPGEDGRGVRLVVNEVPYNGPPGAGMLCTGIAPDAVTGAMTPQFAPVVTGPQSFVLADQLEFCRFWYLAPGLQPGLPPIWTQVWSVDDWPRGIRIEMAPIEPHGGRLQPITVTAPIHLLRSRVVQYGDF